MNYLFTVTFIICVNFAYTYSQEMNIHGSQYGRFDKSILIKKQSGNSHVTTQYLPKFAEYLSSCYPYKNAEDSQTLNVRDITTELLAGSLTTFLVGAFFLDNIDRNIEGNMLGLIANSAVAFGTTLIATSATIYYIGYLLENKGSLKKAIWGGLVGAAFTATLARFVDKRNKDLAYGVMAIGIPIGAVTGFNLSLR